MEITKSIVKKERVIVYVDGFNMYFGMLEAGFEKYKWLNIKKLADSLLKPNQELIEVNYFTSRVGNNPDKQKRQTIYIEALETQGVNIYYGQYKKDTIKCNQCGHKWQTFNEKKTDVNIATHMIVDAYQDRYDMAMLISGDSDLVPPIEAIHENFKEKRVFVAFPPSRHNREVAQQAKGYMTIGRKKLMDSQFPDRVLKKDGFILQKPGEW